MVQLASSSWVSAVANYRFYYLLIFYRFLAGELLAQSHAILERNIHPVVIISAFNKALKEALEIVKRISIPIDTSSDEEMLALIKTSIGTKFVIRWSDLMCRLALQAIRTVTQDDQGMTTVDIKRYARVEKVPGGAIEESRVLDGVMLSKDVTHPHMRRRIANPRIILLDCPLEYKKGESQTNLEIQKENQWTDFQRQEELQVRQMCEKIMEFKPDLVFTEKGVSGGITLDSLVRRTSHSFRFVRLCAGGAHAAKHHGHPPGSEIRQQPNCAGCRCHHCESSRGLERS